MWWAGTDQLTQAHRELLDPVERARWTRLQRADDRDRFTLGSAVVRSLVAELDGTEPTQVALDRACPRCGEQHGPVTAPGRRWHCSVSHSGGLALAAAVAASEASAVGIDVETRCPPDWADLVPDLLARDERAPDDGAAFLGLWVRKEAVLKATREGLSRSMATVDVTGSESDNLRIVDLDVGSLGSAGRAGTVAAAVAVGAQRVRLHWQQARI